VSLVIFTKNYELKKMENFLFTLLVCNVLKLNLRKFFTIYRESLKLSLQNRFYKCSYDFLFLSYSQVKLNRDSDFDNSIKTHRTVICKTDSEN